MSLSKLMMKTAGWMMKTDYSSPDDPVTIDRNIMWMKYFVKGVAEGIPNFVWVLAFQAFAKTMENWQKMDIMKIDNLGSAYTVGRQFGKELFGGE